MKSDDDPVLSTGREELDGLLTGPVIAVTDLGEDHKRRYFEALISQFETEAKQAEDDRMLRENIADRVSWAAGSRWESRISRSLSTALATTDMSPGARSVRG